MSGRLTSSKLFQKIASLGNPISGFLALFAKTDERLYQRTSGGTESRIAIDVLTTKGDLRVFGTAETRLAVGADGTVLTADAAQPNGLKWATPTAGGGLTNWTEGVSTAAPNATIPVVYMRVANAAANVDAAIVPKGTGAIVAAIADNANAGGNKRGSYAVDLQLSPRSAATQVASGAYAGLFAGYGNTAANNRSIHIGGQSNTTTTTNGTAGGTTISCYACSVSGGGTYGTNIAIASYGGTQTGSDFSTMIACDTSIDSGVYQQTQLSTLSAKGAATGGNGAQCINIGVYSAPTFNRSLHIASHGRGYESNAGSRGTEYGHVYTTTGDATPTQMMAGGVKLVIPNSTTYAIQVLVSARNFATGDVCVWRIFAGVTRGANAASTALIGTPAIDKIGGANTGAWSCDIKADTTNGSINIEATGVAATTIYWNGQYQVSKIG